MKNRKSRVLKAIGFSSLALVMGAIGTLAFAPLNLAQISSASEAEMTTEQGLITPKADDPVIYTTESGLEIKWGNALNINASMDSGNLKGFPYFTTTSDGTTYTWVIIGKNDDTYIPTSEFVPYLYSNWKSTVAPVPTTFANYYFNNINDTTTPAGSSIDSNVVSKTYVNDKASRNDIKTSTEIPSSCVLCLSNNVTSGSQTWSTGHWDNAYGYAPTTANVNKTRKTCEDYYTNDAFGFGSNKSLIQSVSLSQYGYYWTDSTGNTSTRATINQYFFPLGNNTSYDNFRWQTYLTADQVKTSYNVWARTSTSLSGAYYITTSGGTGTNGSYQSYGYVRPACVLKLV